MKLTAIESYRFLKNLVVNSKAPKEDIERGKQLLDHFTSRGESVSKKQTYKEFYDSFSPNSITFSNKIDILEEADDSYKID